MSDGAAAAERVARESYGRLVARLAWQWRDLAAAEDALADAFAAALARQHKAELVTGNPEFKAVEREIKVNWLP